jgi:hypothetical protein
MGVVSRACRSFFEPGGAVLERGELSVVGAETAVLHLPECVRSKQFIYI